MPNAISFLRDYLFTMPVLAKFAVGMVMLVTIPRLSRRAHVPVPVGLLLSGVIVGPYVLDIFGTVRPIADFLAELGKLLLMFFAGLEIDLELFRRARNRSIALGIATTVFPLVLGTIVGLSFGYAAIPAIVIGSLLASHTLLGLSIVSRLGLGSLEPVTVAVGATVMSDTLSLVVFAICVSIYTTGFSPSGLALLLAEIAGYIILVLFGLSRLGAYVLKQEASNREGFPAYVADRLSAVKWRNWKVHLIWQENMYAPPQKLPLPKIINLLTGRKEERDVAAYNSWVADPAVRIIGELEASFKKYPPIKLGTPDPYTPPAPASR
jgi:Sodium/hydrogen exchanger family